MIAPNISFDPEIDDFTSLFTSVFNRVEKQLEMYDKVENKFQESLKFNEPSKLKSKMTKVRNNIMSSQNQTDLIAKEIDSMNQWMISLEDQKRTIMKIDNIEIPDEFILKFGTNSAMMKEFEHDLLFYLRNYINSYETPQVIRLKECFKRSLKAKIDRLEMLERVSDRHQQAEKKFIQIDAENKDLTIECQKSDEALAQFSTSEAFLLVQKAKRQKFLVEDWEKRKKELLDEIDTLNIDLNMYKEDNKDKSSNTNIVRKVQEVEDAYTKAVSKWNEQIRLVEEDFKVSITNQQSMMKQLEKDLLSAQLQSLASEKKKTMAEVRAMQASSNRFVSKFSSNRRTLNRKIEASFRKKAMSYQEAVELLRSLHDDELSSLRVTMDGVIEELRNVVNMRKDDSENSTSSFLKKVQNRIELLRATTETAKRRINMQNAEKDIELKAINNRLVTVQGVVDDFAEQCHEFEKLHEQLEERLREQTAKKNECCMNMKKDIDEAQKYINSANFLYVRINAKFEEIEAKSEERNNGDSFLFSKRFKTKALKRSNSVNRFRKFTFDDIIEYRYKPPVKSNIKQNYNIKSKEIRKSNINTNQPIKPTQIRTSSNLDNNKKAESSMVVDNNMTNSNVKIFSTPIEKIHTDSTQPQKTQSDLPPKVDTAKISSEQKNDSLIPPKKFEPKEVKESNPQTENKDPIKESENKEKQNISPPNQPNLPILTPPQKPQLIPRPPAELSPLPPAKRKLITISSSAASLCGQITIIDPTEPEQESQVFERGAGIDFSENKVSDNFSSSRSSSRTDQPKQTEKPSTSRSSSSLSKQSITNATNANKSSIKINTSKITPNANTSSQKSISSVSSKSSGISIVSSASSENNNNNINNDDEETKTTAAVLLTPLKSGSSGVILSKKTIISPNSKLAPLNSPKLDESPPASPSLASFSSSSSLEKPKIKVRVKSRAKNRENSSSSSLSSASNQPSQNQPNKDTYFYENVTVRNKNDSSEKVEIESVEEKEPEKNDDFSLSAERTITFNIHNLNGEHHLTNDDNLNGKIRIEYDKTLTMTPEKKKKKKINVSPRRKPPKQIPNEQPSFVNNRPPRHLTVSTSNILRNKSLHITSNNSNVNVNIVNINDSISRQIPIKRGRYNRFEEGQKISGDGEDNENADELAEKKPFKKKSKKLSVKKKTKKNNENFLKRKKANDQKINGKILAFSLPTAERRALSVKNVAGKSAADSLAESGSMNLNLNNRINGSIISVQHF